MSRCNGSRDLPIVNICTLRVLWTFDPSLHVDVTHLFPREKRVVFEHYVIGVPDDHSQLIAAHIIYQSKSTMTVSSKNERGRGGEGAEERGMGRGRRMGKGKKGEG